MRAIAVVAALWLAGSASFARAADVEVTVEGGKAPLHGAMIMPAGEGKVPAVLLLAGSGPVDRDGNAPPANHSALLRRLAEGLDARGIASLRTDKRGVGASARAAPPPADMRFDVLVDDAVAWVKQLKANPRVGCVFIAGHSQGSMTAALAAAKEKVCGVAILAGPGDAPARMTLNPLKQRLSPELFARAEAINAELIAGRRVADVPPELAATYGPEQQTFLISLFAIDPLKAFAAIEVPVLVIAGDNDLQLTADQARRQAAAARSLVGFELLPGANHALKVSPRDRQGNLAATADANLALAPRTIESLADFVLTWGREP